jgi:hypothetical protein
VAAGQLKGVRTNGAKKARHPREALFNGRRPVKRGSSASHSPQSLDSCLTGLPAVETRLAGMTKVEVLRLSKCICQGYFVQGGEEAGVETSWWP